MRIEKLFIFSLLLITLTQCVDESTFPWWPENYTQNFKTFSGFVPTQLNGTVHYMFIQANSTNYQQLPVVLWMNGGPGCSSMIGLFQEIGPYRLEGPMKNFSQFPNIYSWINRANLLFLETPVGVGFSTVGSSSYQYSDENTVYDAYEALINWFKIEQYSLYLNNSFYIAGEGYAGQTIPLLASWIIYNFETNKIKFKAVMIGNGLLLVDQVGVEIQEQAQLRFLEQHNFLGPNMNQIWQDTCSYYQHFNQPICRYFFAQVNQVMQNVNPENVYIPCWGNATASQQTTKHDFFEQMKLKPKINLKDTLNYTSCTNQAYIDAYMNAPGVQTAFNIKNQITWQTCNPQIRIGYEYYTPGSLFIIPNLIANQILVVLYTGVSDLRVPYILTDIYVNELQFFASLKPDNNYQQFNITSMLGNGTQVGGWWNSYFTQIQNATELAYVRVRAAGHQVPQDKAEASSFILNFTLSDKPWI